MDERWYMVLDSTDDTWSWCVIGKDMSATKRAEQTFAQYSEAYEDARRHGCVDTPRLATLERMPDDALLASMSSVAKDQSHASVTRF